VISSAGAVDSGCTLVQRPAYRVAAQNGGPRELAAQTAQGVCNRAVFDLALHVDDEDVVTQPSLRGPRFDLGQVDMAESELLKDEEKCPRLILGSNIN